MSLEVILKKDCEGLGEEGDIKKVANGYAKNYLLPYGIAVIKNKYNLKKLEDAKEVIQEKKRKKMELNQSLFEKLNRKEFVFKVRADREKLFGSITKNDILNELQKEGYQINKNQVQLKSAIKYLGDHEVDVSLYGDQIAKLKVIVLNQEKEKKQNEKIEKNQSNQNDENHEVEDTSSH